MRHDWHTVNRWLGRDTPGWAPPPYTHLRRVGDRLAGTIADVRLVPDLEDGLRVRTERGRPARAAEITLNTEGGPVRWTAAGSLTRGTGRRALTDALHRARANLAPGGYLAVEVVEVLPPAPGRHEARVHVRATYRPDDTGAGS